MKQEINPSFLPGWLWTGGLAFVVSLIHLLIDFQIGLFGPLSEQVSLAQAALIGLVSLLYGWWGVSFSFVGAAPTRKFGLASLFTLAFLWSFLANGLAGLIACPIPCPGAAPYQDITHVGSIIFGMSASYTAWRGLRAEAGRQAAVWPVTLAALAITAAIFALQGMLFYTSR